MSHTAHFTSPPLSLTAWKRLRNEPRGRHCRLHRVQRMNPAPCARLVYVSGGRGVAALTAAAVIRHGGKVVRAEDKFVGTTEKVSVAVFAVGAGDKTLERDRWDRATTMFRLMGSETMGLFVTRTIVVPYVVSKLDGLSRWIVFRPGAFVPENRSSTGNVSEQMAGRMLLTDNVLANGIVSRERVAELLAAIAMCKVEVSKMYGRVLGVYDKERMISCPTSVVNFLD